MKIIHGNSVFFRFKKRQSLFLYFKFPFFHFKLVQVPREIPFQYCELYRRVRNHICTDSIDMCTPPILQTDLVWGAASRESYCISPQISSRKTFIFLLQNALLFVKMAQEIAGWVPLLAIVWRTGTTV